MTAKDEITDPAGASVVLDHVDKSFGAIPAVDDLSLAVEPNEFMTLLGPSGSGKTTALMMIAGFEIPTGGEIYIDSRPILGLPPHRRNIGMVFQNYALFPHMTVAENIGFPLKQRGFDKAAISASVRAVLETVRLSGLEARYPRQLSGGQQQRVALARAIVFRPRVLLMDEPLSALDKQLREELQLEIKRLHKQLGITFIYVTHDQREALVMSNRIAVINHGRIEQVGAPAELYDRPVNRFVAAFVGESNFLNATAVGNEADTVVANLGSRRVRALGNGPVAAGTPLVLAVRPEKLWFARHKPALSDADINRISAVVLDVTLIGEMYRYLLETEFGAPLTLKQQHRYGAFTPGLSEPVIVEWSTRDTLVV
ncbi:MAG TPA: ABC transporter ATP-binding protein [Stellaceae bacterium]|jgi:spermidine/putrescine ABC transporter ATP-binding subunit|nr:ABC transporter ATP-binding protein [Stellaceae bacterium]